MTQTHELSGLRIPPVIAAAAALLLAVLASQLPAAEPEPSPAASPEDSPKPALTEQISSPSPDGKYALRIMYDAALNEKMTADDPPENEASGEPSDTAEADNAEASGEGERSDKIDSLTIHGLAIISLPGKQIMEDLTKSVFDVGNTFYGPQLLWSSDSRWCAFYLAFPRLGYTNVYHLRGDKFKLAHKPDELEVPAKAPTRISYIIPERWVKPGVLELSVERTYRREEPSDDISGFTASFDGKGKWKVLKKKR